MHYLWTSWVSYMPLLLSSSAATRPHVVPQLHPGSLKYLVLRQHKVLSPYNINCRHDFLHVTWVMLGVSACGSANPPTSSGVLGSSKDLTASHLPSSYVQVSMSAETQFWHHWRHHSRISCLLCLDHASLCMMKLFKSSSQHTETQQ